jgi:hypothetical protein
VSERKSIHTQQQRSVPGRVVCGTPHYGEVVVRFSSRVHERGRSELLFLMKKLLPFSDHYFNRIDEHKTP